MLGFLSPLGLSELPGPPGGTAWALGSPRGPAPDCFLPSLLSEDSWLIGTQVTAEGHTDLLPPQHTHGPQAQHDKEAQRQGHREGGVCQRGLLARARRVVRCVWEEGRTEALGGLGESMSLQGSGQGGSVVGGEIQEASWKRWA